jgi:MFS family permease
MGKSGGMNSYQLLCIFYVTLGSIFYGYDSGMKSLARLRIVLTVTGITTSILGYTRFLEYFDLTAVTIGAFNSAYYGGAFVGCTLNWWLPDALGRLRTIQLSCVIAIVGIALQTASNSFPLFCTGRVIGGVASGLIFSVCPVYASEISPPELRGRVAGIYAYVALLFCLVLLKLMAKIVCFRFNVNAAYMLTEWM